MDDLRYASHLAYHIALWLIIPATLLRWGWGPSPLGHWLQVFGFVFLAWSAVLWLSRYLPWTFLGL